MRIEWTDVALASLARYMKDQRGMMDVNRAVAALSDDPAPPEAFIRGEYRRLRVGGYRVLYRARGDVITVIRVDRVD